MEKWMSKALDVDTHFTYNHPLLSALLRLFQRRRRFRFLAFRFVLAGRGSKLHRLHCSCWSVRIISVVRRMRGLRHPPSSPTPPLTILLTAYLIKSHSLWHFVVWKTLRHVHDVEGQLSHVGLRQGVTTVGLLLTFVVGVFVGFLHSSTQDKKWHIDIAITFTLHFKCWFIRYWSITLYYT